MSNEIMRHKPLFSDLSELHQTLDRLINNNLIEWEKDFPAMEMAHWVPKIDVKDKNNKYCIRADLPGVNAKDMEVTLEGGVLTIKGKKESEIKEEKEDYVRVERSAGSFFRAISLQDVDDDAKVSAKSKNGVLEIVVPKNGKTKSHKIQIKEE